MTLRTLQRTAWLAPALSTFLAPAHAYFWTVTSRFELSMSTETYSFLDESTYYTYTSTRTIVSGVTPTATVVSTTTYERSYMDILEVSAYYPPDSVKESDLVPEDALFGDATTTTDYTGTVFYMPVTYTAPATCTSQFTFSTDESVYIPTDVVDQIQPASVITDPPTTYATWTAPPYETWYLTEGAAPITTESEYYYTEYIEHCSKPYDSSYTPGARGGGGGGGSYRTCFGSSYDYGTCALKIWIIIIAAVIPSLFLLGFIESWFWFRRLMTGRGCLRLGTISWICISLWVLCFTRSQSARSQDDQKLLREQWNAMKGSTAFKLWWKYGFRHRYPEEILGKYDRNTIGIQKPGQPPVVGIQYVPPTHYTGPPPPGGPVYFPQQGVPMMQQPYPVYFDPSKEGQSRVSEIPAPLGQQMSYPPHQQPPMAGTVQVPAPYSMTRSPPPNNASEMPSPIASEVSATPFPQHVQPHMTGSPSPPQYYMAPPGTVPANQGHQYAGPMPPQMTGSPSPVPTNVAEAPTPQSMGSPVSQPATLSRSSHPPGALSEVPAHALPSGTQATQPPHSNS
ncbi:hypothetical protein EJ04DRAFT_488070 [Polyplosphaeria fusca]|uniref:Uncharacterized protein n=1 Tax=Polyplosphaeria fusca TaxID=682080 RepID=A0A9P4R6P2_9PLEO|nr:hypothetical protein EJ04DRAFT_488070 [Polyplosphaeria fusca]